MIKIFVLLATVAVSCKKIEEMRLQNKRLATDKVRLTVTYIGSDNCRRYLKKQQRSPKYIDTVVARNEKFGRYPTHLLGGDNGDFAGINTQGLAFSGDKFFANEYRKTRTNSLHETLTKLSGDRKNLLTMRAIETNCRRLLVNIYSPVRRPKVVVIAETRIYPQQEQRFREDFADDFGILDCDGDQPCSFAELKGWYFLYVMPNVDNFVKLLISIYDGKKYQEKHLNVYGLVGYFLGKDERRPR